MNTTRESQHRSVRVLVCAAIAMCLAMTACTSSSSSNSKYGTKKDGVVQVAITPVLPYIGQRGDGLTGLNGEIFTEIAKRLDLRIQSVMGDFPSLLTNVQTRRVDLGVANIVWTAQRANSALMTDPLYYSPTVLAERPGLNLSTVDSLQGHKLGTSTAAAYLPGLKAIPHASVDVFSTPEDLLSALSSGRIEVAAIDPLTPAYAKEKNSGLNFHTVPLNPPTAEQVKQTPELASLQPVMLCYYVAKKDKALETAINRVIADLYSSGFLPKTVQKWGGDPAAMLTPDAATLDRFTELRAKVDRPDNWRPSSL
jgi:ABC-type amino acid transport substrate-binding protein